MSQEYTQYIVNHRAYVQEACLWLMNHGIIEGELAPKVAQNVASHDMSKYQQEEYVPYDEYFYGKKTDKVEKAFNYAWLHHIHANPHHWQYWVLINDDDGTKALEMPEEYVYEMFADHWSFSWKAGNLLEIKTWYDNHKKSMILHENTRKLYENILNKVIAILKIEDK